MLVDEAQAIELPGGQARDPLRHHVVSAQNWLTARIARLVRIIQCNTHPA